MEKLKNQYMQKIIMGSLQNQKVKMASWNYSAAKELGMTLVPIKIDDDLYDETFTIRAYHTEKGIEATMNVHLDSLY